MLKRLSFNSLLRYILYLNILYGLRNVSAEFEQEIPQDILSQIEGASSYEDLTRRVTILPSTRLGGNSSSGQTRGGVGVVQPSQGSERSVDGKVFDAASGADVIENPRQSNDSCKIVKICAPLPLVDETGVMPYPRCIELEQCLGGCCKNAHNCYAVETEPIIVKLRRLRYKGRNPDNTPKMEELPSQYVNMQRHKKCGCNPCSGPPLCNDKQELINCKCRCKNQAEQRNCVGENRRWAEDSCECKCIRSSCPLGTLLDPDDCRCKNLGTDEHSEEITYDYNTRAANRAYDDRHSRTTTKSGRRSVHRPGP